MREKRKKSKKRTLWRDVGIGTEKKEKQIRKKRRIEGRISSELLGKNYG